MMNSILHANFSLATPGELSSPSWEAWASSIVGPSASDFAELLDYAQHALGTSSPLTIPFDTRFLKALLNGTQRSSLQFIRTGPDALPELCPRAPGANTGSHTRIVFEIGSKADLPTRDVEHQDTQALANDLAKACCSGKSLTLSNAEAALGLGNPTGATGMAVQNGRKAVPSQ